MFFNRLKEKGILGMNCRIGNYMSRYNSRDDYPKVDDKVLTDELAKKNNVPMPPIYHVFDSFGDVKNIPDILNQHSSFVIKPARGAMGNGIIVIDSVQNNEYIKSSGAVLKLKEIRYHIQSIMSGLYTINSTPDRAIIQYKINLHPVFEEIAFQGIPDIRVIVFLGKPVMAMVRLPTSQSDGRANLHQGAVGTGVDMETGQLTTTIIKNKIVEEHPDTGKKIQGIKIPEWNKILEMAALSYKITNLGYLGVDIAIDRDLGPVIIEMNARPGLSIQIANQLGLKRILEDVEATIRAKV
jgi:alpha-L-glutamate ligase-like protein